MFIQNLKNQIYLILLSINCKISSTSNLKADWKKSNFSDFLPIMPLSHQFYQMSLLHVSFLPLNTSPFGCSKRKWWMIYMIYWIWNISSERVADEIGSRTCMKCFR